jgi:hypothetical protein
MNLSEGNFMNLSEGNFMNLSEGNLRETFSKKKSAKLSELRKFLVPKISSCDRVY